jgi:hypothetical protein
MLLFLPIESRFARCPAPVTAMCRLRCGDSGVCWRQSLAVPMCSTMVCKARRLARFGWHDRVLVEVD